MPKPVCVKCQRFYRPKRNGYIITEMKPKPAYRPVPPGDIEPEMWEPYKIYRSDLWHCLGCGHELAILASQPVAEHYEPHFEELSKSSQSVINDC